MSKKVLIIEDESTINKVISQYFIKEQYEVHSAFDGEDGLIQFSKIKPDLICLDVMMPKINGWEVAKMIRETSDVPIIIMSALSDDESILNGYDLKVDDYVTKPFNPKILLAKANRILSRNSALSGNKDLNTRVAGNIKVNLDEHRVFINEQEETLSKTEYDLLLYFMDNQHKICSRDNILASVWGMESYTEQRIVDTYVKKLRKLLKDNDYIKTVFGIGYRFEVE